MKENSESETEWYLVEEPTEEDDVDGDEDGEQRGEDEHLQVVHRRVGDRLEQHGGDGVPDRVDTRERDHQVHVDVLRINSTCIHIHIHIYLGFNPYT